MGVWPDGSSSVQIFPSEGGESDFVARTADEWALREHIAREAGPGGHVKVEHVVSGLGISRIYDFLRQRGPRPGADCSGAEDAAAQQRDEAAALAVEAEVRASADPSATVSAHADPLLPSFDPTCGQALDMFLDALGAEAANLALRFQAHGGVYVAGGVTAKFAPLLAGAGGRRERLRAAYLGKGRSTDAYRGCPLHVVTTEGDDLVMEGLWRFASASPTLLHG